MDKIRALELLKQAKSEITQLEELQYDNKDFGLWFDKVKQIINSGLSKDDWTTFISTDLPVLVINFRTPDTVRQNYYLKRLDAYGVNIEKIIRKYRILGVEEEPAAVAKQPLGKKIRKQLSGKPEELAPHIVRVASEFQFPQGFNCYAEEDSYKSSQFSKQFTIYRITGCFTPGVIWGGAKPEELPVTIGTIALQSLPSNKTLLIAKHTLPTFDSESSYFDSFLERLSLEFRNLDIEETTVQKTWRWLNRIIELWNKLKP